MTVTVNLPQQVEQAYLAAARSKGVTVDTLVADLLVSHAPPAESPNGPEMTNVQGIPVLRTGQPLEKIARDVERDYWLSADEAKEFGLVDQVIAKRPS